MSTHFNQYIIAGVLTTKLLDYEDIEAYVDHGYNAINSIGDITVVYDGMHGEYMIAGYAICRSDIDEPIDKKLNLTSIAKQISLESIKIQVKDMLNLEGELGVWFVTHWH